MAIINGRGRVGIRRPSAAATPSIVLDGLKLYLDAGNAASYAGTGTVWTDLSGNGNNATLVNGGSGLTFSNLNSGEIYFDGSNDYVIFDSPKPATTLSIGVWFNSSVIDNAWRKIFLLPYHNSSNTSRLSPYSSYQIVTVSSKIGVDFNVDANYMSNRVEDATTVPLANTWYYVCGTFNSGVIKIYVNGALKNTKDISSRGTSIMYSNGTRGIMGVTSYVQLVEQYRGKISNAHVYSKVLSDAEVLQNFDLMKARFYPQVSDADAQSFIYAAGIQDSTQGNAVNALVTSLKSAGIWTKMKAVYPMVGGSAASHKWNLKDPRDLDAAYRLAFTAGWVHSSTGAKPNGTSDYADTKFIPATNFTAGAGHISYYSRTNSFGVKRDISAYGSGNIYSYSRFDSANSGWFRFSGAEVGYSNSDSRGWYMMSRTSTNSYFYKNAIYKAGGASSTFGASVISIGGGTAGTYSDREIAFASIGDYLTDAENASFCAIVQTYQTSLGRQV